MFLESHVDRPPPLGGVQIGKAVIFSPDEAGNGPSSWDEEGEQGLLHELWWNPGVP